MLSSVEHRVLPADLLDNVKLGFPQGGSILSLNSKGHFFSNIKQLKTFNYVLNIFYISFKYIRFVIFISIYSSEYILIYLKGFILFFILSCITLANIHMATAFLKLMKGCFAFSTF